MLVLAGLSVADDLEKWDFAVAEIVPGPGNLDEPAWKKEIIRPGVKATEDLIVAYDENNYRPHGYCQDIVNATGDNFKDGVFRVESLVGQLKKEVEKHGPSVGGIIPIYPFSIWHWMAHYTMDYTVTCGNKITYKGTFKWRVELLNCQVGCSDEDDHDMRPHDLDVDTYNYTTNAFTSFPEAEERGKNVVPIKDLITAWNERQVEFPAWTYTGEPGKTLTHPVLFVHGLNSDYEIWGVKSNAPKPCDGCEKKAQPEFMKALVKSYENGSAPDILARTYNIPNTGDAINKNGIYFYQTPGEYDKDGNWIEARPSWDATPSQSKRLYERIKEVLNDFYGSKDIDWTTNEKTYIDLIGHSQGGLTIREMFRGLKIDPGEDGTGTANAANHVRKVITVDTPHFGSELATENPDDISEEFSGLKKIVKDLDASKTANPPEHELVKAELDIDWLEYISAATEDAKNHNKYYCKNFSINGINACNVLGWFGGTFIYLFDKSYLTIKGPYIGKYVATVSLEGPHDDPNAKTIVIDKLEPVAEDLYYSRHNGIHLDPTKQFMSNLNKVINGKPPYPEKPNGELVNMLPLYSPKSTQVLSSLLGSVSYTAEKLCEDYDDDASGCFVIGKYFNDVVVNMSKEEGFDISKASIKTVNSELWKALVEIQDTWFGQSDALVTEYSQKFVDQNLRLSPENIAAFTKPRRFVFHDAMAPWEDILHGPFSSAELNINIAGATMQGLDIVCALDLHCDDVAHNDASKIIYLNMGTVDFVGDFDVAPIFMNQGTQEIKVSDATYALTASYIPGTGSVVRFTDENGVEHQETLFDGSVATSPSIKRIGQVLHVTFTNQSGKTFEKDYQLSNLSATTTFAVVVGAGEVAPSVVMAKGTAANPSTQTPPVSPIDRVTKNSPVTVYHREARAQHEKNTSRPRILVVNDSKKDIVGFKVAYYFTADPARKPVVEVDYPKIPVSLENLGGDQWRFILDASDQVLTAGSILPNVEGWQIRIHYEDWTNYKFVNDWSADHNYGIPAKNSKIVVYDLNDNIIWGIEPSAYKSVDERIIPQATATMTWHDSAPDETNYLKPAVTIKNTGSVSLRNYKAKIWFRVPEGKELYVPADDWYTPNSIPSLTNMGENVWELVMSFKKFILYPGESVKEGDVGVHLKDWSTFDKTVCGMALLDAEDNVIFGSVPTVEHCKSFDEPGLLTPLYTWKF
ncbi:esterase/lipase family protein [Fibrobacter sp.]|uniref:esterase/lipase family protein n=1 Tax=Fibrobacter sp. TaxID=35828 RepID=UPI00386F9C86